MNSSSALSDTALEAEILRLTAELTQRRLSARASVPFVPGTTGVPYGGRVYDAAEVQAAVNASLDFWLTLGPEGDALERELAQFLGLPHVRLVNSGSSANLLALAALTSPRLERPLRPGDEVITVAAGFPTTVNPILQYGCIPVFLDVDFRTANIDVTGLTGARSPKTRAVMLAHTLGNPFDLDAVLSFCRNHGLYLIEDNCDALGSLYHGRLTGTFGHLGTSSFYPPHHMTMGEGGAVYSRDQQLIQIVESFRDWGRDCSCPSGKDNCCGKRFAWDWPTEQQRERAEQCNKASALIEGHGGSGAFPDGNASATGSAAAGAASPTPGAGAGAAPAGLLRAEPLRGCLPPGYDHKYVYSHIGYNLKPTDIQAAIGRVQLRKLAEFGAARRRHWQWLRRELAPLENHWQFQEPTAGSDPSWFGLLMTMREPDHERLTRICRALEAKRIGHRRLFAGNILWQPAYRDIPHRVAGTLANTEKIALGGLFLGVYPGLTDEMLAYVAETMRELAQW